MPFRNIDFHELSRQSVLQYDLGRKIAIINAKNEKDIPKVQFLTGIQLQHIDPVDEAIELEKQRKKQKPIMEKLSEIADKTLTVNQLADIVKTNIAAIDYNRLGETIPSLTQPTLQEALRYTLEGNVDKDIDADILKKYEFPAVSQAIKDMSVEELQVLQKSVGATTKSVALKSGRDKNLVNDKEVLKLYNRRLKHAIDNHSVFKVNIKGKGLGNSRKLGGSLYYTNVNDLIKRLHILLGEIQAGNNSSHVKNELADICHHLYKNKSIKKAEYRRILARI